jgi:hypothetical protein
VRFRPFHVAGEGSQISMPIPAEVDGASAGPGLPGPTFNLTRHTSFEATSGGGDAGVPDNASRSPFLNALTKVTVVLASGLNAVFIQSSQVNAMVGAQLSSSSESSPSQAAEAGRPFSPAPAIAKPP